MSSDEELGGYGPTTPAPPKKGSRPAPRPAKVVAAGPSKPATTVTTKKGAEPASEANEDSAANLRDVVVLSSDEDARKAAAARKDTAGKGKGKEPGTNTKAAAQTNGKGKTKGKAKAVSPQPMEVDNAQAAEDSAPPARTTRATRTNPKPISEAHSPPPAKRHKPESALEAEILRLRQRLDEVAAQRDRLGEQLKEALEVRETEPERLLAESMTQYEATMQAQQHLLQEQANSLAHFKAIPDSRQLHTLEFITREVAAEESKGVTERNKKLEQTVKEKNSRISELEAKNKELDKQLEAEIQMAKEYREKNPFGSKSVVSGPIRGQNGTSAPYSGEVIKLYEDLSNFLVTKVVGGQTMYPAFPDLQEVTYHCAYTYVEPNYKGRNPSLQFTLRRMWSRADEESTAAITSKKSLVEKIEYSPMNLEKESKEFEDHLEFLSSPFIFDRTQMHIFLRTVSEHLAALSGEEEADEDQLNESQ